MITTIIGWIINAIMGGIFKVLDNKAREKAEKERDAARIAAITGQEAHDLETEIFKQQQEAERAFKDKKPPDDDPFRIREWNR